MKTIFITLVTALTTSFLHAQNDPKIVFGEEFTIADGSSHRASIHCRDNNYIAIFSKTQGFDVKRLGPDLKVIEEKDINLNAEIGKGFFESSQITLKTGHWTMFYSKVGGKDACEVKMCKLNEQKLGFETPVVAMKYTSADAPYCRSLVSPDSSKVVVYYESEPKGKATTSKVRFVVLDDSMKELWKGEYDAPVQKQGVYGNFASMQVFVSNEGTLYFVAPYTLDGEQKIYKDGAPNFYFSVVELRNGSSAPLNHRIEIGQYYVSSWSRPLVFFNKEHRPIVLFEGNNASKYETVGNGYTASGDYGFMPVTIEAGGNKTYALKDHFNTMPVSLFRSYGDNNKFPNMQMKIEVAQRFASDGSLMIVFNPYERTMKDDEKRYDNIYVIGLDNQLKLSWQKSIPRKFYTGGMSGTLYVLDRNNQFGLMYYDDPKNIDLPETASPAKYSTYADDGELLIRWINSKGELRTQRLGESSKFPTKNRPGLVQREAPNKFLLDDREEKLKGKISTRKFVLIN